eukprot:1358004-Amphidinium_carterae.1
MEYRESDSMTQHGTGATASKHRLDSSHLSLHLLKNQLKSTPNCTRQPESVAVRKLKLVA